MEQRTPGPRCPGVFLKKGCAVLDDSVFVSYPKISRLSRADMTITEKIDGTNGLIVVRDGVVVCAGSRNRALRPEGDNFGFARAAPGKQRDIARDFGVGQACVQRIKKGLSWSSLID